MQANSEKPIEWTTASMTELDVKNKVKRMAVGIINAGLTNGNFFTTRMIRVEENVGNLYMTTHDKERLIMQCEELFGIELSASWLMEKNLGELIKRVVDALVEQGRIYNENTKEQTSEETSEG